MSSDWWFDIILVLLLGGLGLLAWALRRVSAQADVSEHFEVDLEASKPPRKWGLYPQKLIRQSGFSSDRAKWVYWPLKVSLALLAPMALIEITTGEMAGAGLAAAAIVAFLVPDLFLVMRRRRRRMAIASSMSFFVSLMVVYLRSGMGLAQAFDNSAKYGLTDDNPLSKEVSLLTQEIAAGRERDEAFACLAERTGVEELERISAVMSVGFSVGSPVAQTLEAQADLLRAKQRQAGTELANRKTMEAMLPMIMVCFPMFLVLVFYPAGAQIYEVLQLMKELF
ncbi:type II secretion system F family protein [Litorivivens sp.]|uniref:type II secretion system F family protein n=1 Tax=Litorivivens sp. TaxID=2020868 RepID=UPI00356A0A5F